ncbi:hypothetical protein CVT24_003236 [Panaeolus cyanescens]|uniref:Uncharacterized protein n=1 Tax=Panaeolus cyanescens TaxID=181874 RepID=A0A409YRE0_9AGAR|nr:hypothetical protein CVT24_003236 [Panaeolus cyanescens]
MSTGWEGVDIHLEANSQSLSLQSASLLTLTPNDTVQRSESASVWSLPSPHDNVNINVNVNYHRPSNPVPPTPTSHSHTHSYGYGYGYTPSHRPSLNSSTYLQIIHDHAHILQPPPPPPVPAPQRTRNAHQPHPHPHTHTHTQHVHHHQYQHHPSQLRPTRTSSSLCPPLTRTSSTLGGLDVYHIGLPTKTTHLRQPVYSVLEFEMDTADVEGGSGSGAKAQGQGQGQGTGREDLGKRLRIDSINFGIARGSKVSLPWTTIETPNTEEMEENEKARVRARMGKRLKKRTKSEARIGGEERGGVADKGTMEGLSKGRNKGTTKCNDDQQVQHPDASVTPKRTTTTPLQRHLTSRLQTTLTPTATAKPKCKSSTIPLTAYLYPTPRLPVPSSRADSKGTTAARALDVNGEKPRVVRRNPSTRGRAGRIDETRSKSHRCEKPTLTPAHDPRPVVDLAHHDHPGVSPSISVPPKTPTDMTSTGFCQPMFLNLFRFVGTGDDGEAKERMGEWVVVDAGRLAGRVESV